MKMSSVLVISLTVLLLVSCSATQAEPTEPLLPRTAATAIAESGDNEWTLVVIGDSTTWGIPERYAANLEQDLDVNITIIGHAQGGYHSQDLLNDLRNDETLRQDFRQADVIYFQIPRSWFLKICGYSYDVQHIKECFPKAVEAYKADVDGIITEIVELRGPTDALIRTADAYSHWPVAQAKSHGIQDLIHSYWLDTNEHLTQVATEHQIPVAKVYAAFNGPDGGVDPVETGYIQAMDVTHLTEQGKDLLANLIRKLGYEYATE